MYLVSLAAIIDHGIFLLKNAFAINGKFPLYLNMIIGNIGKFGS